MMRSTPLACAVLLAACGSSPARPATTVEPRPEPDTSGGASEEPEPGVVRTTTPVPVPQPAVAREDLSDPLQALWTDVEETVAIRPPEPPSEASEEAVEAWANGPFSEWMTERRQAMTALVRVLPSVPDEPRYERAVASALLGYALEDFAADMRGVPVPETVAEDPERLSRHAEELRRILRPIARDAVVSYAFCQRQLAALGDDSPWLPWRAYCVQRGREIIDVFELSPPEPAAPQREGEEPASGEEPQPTSGDAEPAPEEAAAPASAEDPQPASAEEEPASTEGDAATP